jgi:hypothetical protein
MGSTTAPEAGAAARNDGGAAPQQDSQPGKKDTDDEPAPSNEPPRQTRPSDPKCGLSITDVALYQGVKVVLVNDGVEVKRREVDVVQQRRALMRVFLKATGNWKGGTVTAKLTVKGNRGSKTLEDQRAMARSSSDGELDSTLNFEIPAEHVAADASYVIAVTAPSACEALRFPSDGEAALGARRVGALKIKLVPIKFAADGSDRLPDTSDEQLARFRAHLLAMFPVATVELSVRAPVKSSIKVTGEPGGWNDLLDAMRDLRTQDKPGDDVFYFGLISPAKSLEAYCPDACYFGLSFRTDQPAATYQAGVGLGFGGEHSASVLAHEMGHLMGRKHAPCKTTTYLDPQYPQSEGKTGSWGFDERSRTLYSPEATRDMMGYCSPAWISAYTFDAIMDRAAQINAGQTKVATATLEPVREWRTLVAGEGRARWGVAAPVTGTPAGIVEEATVRDRTGAVIATVPVWRHDVGEEGSWSVLVPVPQAGWHSIQVGGAPALAFDAPSVAALEP